MLVYFEPAALCDLHSTGLLLGPLPARKQLWEADDERAWKKESEESTSGQFGLATSGELVRVDGNRYCCGYIPTSPSRLVKEKVAARSTAGWEEWCKDMDGFGGLILLTASLTT